MLPPDVKTTIKIKDINSKVVIMSYRKINRDEAESCIGELLRKEKRFKKNTTYTVITLIGA